jgi:hypothetical protein
VIALAKWLARYQESAGEKPWSSADIAAFIQSHGVNKIQDLMQDNLGRLLEELPILPLSELAENALMWSYYANGHKGYAIEFATDQPPFSGSQIVTYSATYPLIDIERIEEPMHALERGLLVKADFWAHEREWRIVGSRGVGAFDWDPRAPAPPAMGRFARVSRAAIRRIIVGARVSAEEIIKLRALANRADPPVQVAQCTLSADRFHIDIRNQE